MEKLVEREVSGKLGALKLAIRTRVALEGVGWLLAAAVAVVFITLGMDYLLRLDKAQRVLVMLAWLCGLAYLCWRRLLTPMFVPMSKSDLALLVENRFGGLGDRLISAIQFENLAASVGGMSRAMILKVAQEANSIAGSLNFGDVVRSAGAKRSGSIALGALLVLAGLGLWKPAVLGLWFQRNILFLDTPWPQDTYLVVQGGPDFSVVRGDDLRISITVSDNTSIVPTFIAMHTQSASYGDWIEERLDQAEAGGRTFVKIFQNVPEEFQFYVTGGDDSNDRKHPHKVRIIEPPTLMDLEFPSVVYPGYMRRPESTLAGGTSVQKLPVGCRVSVRAVSNKPLKAARLVATTEITQSQQAIVKLLQEMSADMTEITGRMNDLSSGDSAIILKTADKLKAHQKTLMELTPRQQEAGRLIVDNWIGRMDDVADLIIDGKPVSRPAGKVQTGQDCLKLAELLKESSELAGKAAGVLQNDRQNAAGQIKAFAEKVNSLVEIAAAIHEQMTIVPLRIRGVESENLASRADAVLARHLGGTGPARDMAKTAPAAFDENSVKLELGGKYCIDGVNRSQVANLKFWLTDESGYTSRKGQEFQVQVQPDQPPTVQLFRPGQSLFGPIITSEAQLPLQVQADDEYGVSSIQFQVSAKPADGSGRPVKDFRPINLPITPGAAEEPPKSLKSLATVDLAKWEDEHKADKQALLDLKPGDTLEIRADAQDNMPHEFRGPNVASSQIMAFQVIARAEFIRLLIAKQKEAQKEFNQIVEMQSSAYGKIEDVIKLLDGAQTIDPDAQRKIDESGGLQQTISSQLIKSAGTFKAILDEMVINRVGSPAEQQAVTDIARSLTALVAVPDPAVRDSASLCQKVNRDLAACKEIYKDAKAVAKLADASQSVAEQQKAIHAEMLKIMQMMKQVDNLMEVIRDLDEIIQNLRLRQEEMEILKRYSSGKVLENATSRPASAPADGDNPPPSPK